MKQKVVIHVPINNPKSRSKALKIAVGVSGVDSAAIKDGDKTQIEVVGDGIDAVDLTSLLRKKFSHATLESVDEDGGDKKDEKPPQPPEPVVYWYPYCAAWVDPYYNNSSYCSWW